MHNAWCCSGKEPYCFTGSSVKCQNHRFWPKLERFWTVTPVWIHWWLWNDAHSLKQHRRGALLFFKPSVKFKKKIEFRGHRGCKIDDLNPIWVQLLGRSQLSHLSDVPCSNVVHSNRGVRSGFNMIGYRCSIPGSYSVWLSKIPTILRFTMQSDANISYKNISIEQDKINNIGRKVVITT